MAACSTIPSGGGTPPVCRGTRRSDAGSAARQPSAGAMPGYRRGGSSQARTATATPTAAAILPGGEATATRTGSGGSPSGRRIAVTPPAPRCTAVYFWCRPPTRAPTPGCYFPSRAWATARADPFTVCARAAAARGAERAACVVGGSRAKGGAGGGIAAGAQRIGTCPHHPSLYMYLTTTNGDTTTVGRGRRIRRPRKASPRPPPHIGGTT
eukprot:scaffold17824_cov90-Isochrysis_galbana.AAC.1